MLWSCRRIKEGSSLFDEGALQRMEVTEAVNSEIVVAVAVAQERTAKQLARQQAWYDFTSHT